MAELHLREVGHFESRRVYEGPKKGLFSYNMQGFKKLDDNAEKKVCLIETLNFFNIFSMFFL